MTSDKDRERERYDARARAMLATGSSIPGADPLDVIPLPLQAPYRCYAEKIRAALVTPEMRVLELGAGFGAYTGFALHGGARVTATDISESALSVLRRRLAEFDNLDTKVADMEDLPFEAAEFDLVLSAGSLSYGDNLIVMNEIYRVLQPSGKFICVDSLDHNPVYRLNRWLQYLRGRRTRSTVARMPTLDLIAAYENRFGYCETGYFGAISWITPLLSGVIGAQRAARLSEKFDGFFRIKRSAFKFVMAAEKRT